jgi:creatinine amidohydrolase
LAHTGDRIATSPRSEMQAYTNSGVIGYPSRDTAEKGKKVINHLGQAAQSLTALLISQST